MLVHNIRLENDGPLAAIRIENGVIVELGDLAPQDGESLLDGEGGLVSAPFIEPHVHLDTTLTAGEPEWNKSGTLFEGIERWSQRKPFCTREDVIGRAEQVLEWQLANGVQHVRTHVDVTDPDLVALKAMLEVKERVADWMDLQIVAFPQEGILSFPNGVELLEESLRLGADVVGGIPHFEFTREYGVESMNLVFELAEKYDRLVDIHCDEIDDEQSRFLETVATRALESGLAERVTASHTTAMHSYNAAYTSRLFRLLRKSNINFVANPLVNIHLQGRFDDYPKRRGVTRVKELLAAGINTCFGHDDVFDPWYPMGTGNMLQVLHMGMHVCQMMGYDQLNDSLKLISTNSAKTLNLGETYGLVVGRPANFLIHHSTSEFEILRRQGTPRMVIRKGEIVAETARPDIRTRVNGDRAVTFDRPHKS